MGVPSTPLAPGTTLHGKTSWFGGPNDPTSGPTTASGSPIAAGGIAVYNEATLGGYWRVTFPNGKSAVLKQTDIGPAPFTGRLVDVAYSSLAGIGYSEGDFPTNGQVTATYLGKSATSTAAGSSAGGVSSATAASPGVAASSTAGGGPSESNPSGGQLTSEGLLGISTKALLYVGLIIGAVALLWLGSSTFLKPRPPASS